MSDFTYMRKPVPVEAFMIPPDDEMTRAWPSWFLPEIVKGVLVPLADGAIKVCNSNPESVFAVPAGDWLVRNSNGLYEGFGTTEFVRTFEKPATALRG